MKVNLVKRNKRLFINAVNGKPKRVKTVTDDYGNRVHIVKGKVKPALRKLSNAKKNYRNFKETTPIEKNAPKIWDSKRGDKDLVRIARHSKSRDYRKNIISLNQDNKIKYHENRTYPSAKKYKSAHKKASVAAAAIHKGKRKAKDFTK